MNEHFSRSSPPDLLLEEKLVFVTTSRNGRKPTPDTYVHVDWGPEFAAQFSLAFPDLSGTAVSASLGPLGLGYVLAAGGAGYFRMAAVREHLRSGRLHVVKATPEFSYPVHAVYPANAGSDGLALGLTGLRTVVGAAAPTVPSIASRHKR